MARKKRESSGGAKNIIRSNTSKTVHRKPKEEEAIRRIPWKKLKAMKRSRAKRDRSLIRRDPAPIIKPRQEEARGLDSIKDRRRGIP